MGTWFWLAGCGVAAPALAVLAVRSLVIVHVVGTSMQPAYQDGDTALVRCRRGRLSVGSVVVLLPPLSGSPGAVQHGWLIKRVAALPGDRVPEAVRGATNGVTVVPAGTLVVLSDNPVGMDSRQWGFIPAADVLGAVTAKLPSRPATGLSGDRWPRGRMSRRRPAPAEAPPPQRSHQGAEPTVPMTGSSGLSRS